ncbi:hypothetical protein UFOVP151_29 [uncultured Caudovirales phage]|uniref:Uncharacterized protein n=1 Tax=uncultured Caudovirales phage TaxID=2100421 RepID=A0A6J7WCD5_9CAUD|nr:hypothetical protein UFOVP151_29 [uncultured Caudovirales phage]
MTNDLLFDFAILFGIGCVAALILIINDILMRDNK